MCDTREVIDNVQLTRCGHGNFHLHLGKMTLHLTHREMQLLVHAAAMWVESAPPPRSSSSPEDDDRPAGAPGRMLPWD